MKNEPKVPEDEQRETLNPEPLFSEDESDAGKEKQNTSVQPFDKAAYRTRILRAIVEGAERALKRDQALRFIKRRPRRRR